MTLNFISACPYCGKHVEPLRVGDIMNCPLCGKMSKLVIETVSDEPKIKKIGMNKQEQQILNILINKCEYVGEFEEENLDYGAIEKTAKEIFAIFKQPYKDTRSKRERALDAEFERMNIKPHIYHFTKRALLRGAFTAITVAQIGLRGQEGRGGHTLGYDAISTYIEKSTRLKMIEQATHLIEEFEKIDIYGIAICDKRDVFNKHYGRMKAKGRLMQHLLEEAQEK